MNRDSCCISQCLFWAFWLLPLALWGQAPLSNLRQRTLDARLAAQPLDSLTVASPLLAVSDSANGQSIDFQYFKLQNNLLLTDTARLRAAFPNCEKIQITYRVLPQNLGTVVRRLDTTAIRRAGFGDDYIGFDYTPFAPQKPLWENSGLTTAGGYTRGLSFGNAQNLVFNSNLNLQLDGKLGNDVALRAAISDNSVPLQPDGTTRQLKEFDRIFVELSRRRATLVAGDFDLAAPLNGGHFLRYFKRAQGASASNFHTMPRRAAQPADTLLYRTTAAISRGKFARQNIAGREGNQGPYRLQGTEGEQFIIVLAGTERVFLDGQRLQRGAADDYVMDYNLGELSFTPRRLITKDSRIVVEFEYATQAYLRSTVATSAEWRSRRARAHFDFYSEQDGRAGGPAQDLSPAERRALALAGDALAGAVASGVDTLAEAAFDPDRVLYRYADTLACGQPVRVLVYATDPQAARYAARFSQVGQGRGNYVQVATAANGRVFRWVAPDAASCQPQGDFEPIVRLVAPELRQMTALGIDFQTVKRGTASAEIALSNRDLNRFSPLGNADDVGAAAFARLRQPVFSPKKNGGWQGALAADYEFAGRNFSPLNPYRAAEFVRDWNLPAAAKAADEHIARSSFSLEKQGLGAARYEFGAFSRQQFFAGERHFAETKLARRDWALAGEANFLNTESAAERTRFSRPKADFSWAFHRKIRLPASQKSQPDSVARRPVLKTGLYAEREKNERKSAGADTLSAASFWYDLGKIYWQLPENQRAMKAGGFVSRRSDYTPRGQFFAKITDADEANFNGAWQREKTATTRASHQLAWNLTARNLHIRAAELTNLEPQKTYLGRLDYAFSGWKNALALTSGYELGSGQSPKTEFTYVQTNPGEGQYAWIDRNRDSVLQVDEMELAVFQDQANYIRVAVTTANFIRTNNVALNQSLRVEPRLAWQTRRGWRRQAARFSLQSNLQISRRTQAEGAAAWNPLARDTALVTETSGLRNALFFNRADPKWDVSLTQTANRNQLALTTGFEQRSLSAWAAHGRLRLSAAFSAEADASLSEKNSSHDQFSSRNYAVAGWEIGPRLTWQPKRDFRAAAKFRAQNSQNRAVFGGEKAEQWDFSAELAWNPAGKTNAATGFQAATSVRAKGTFAAVKFDGLPNSAVGYAMLDGLQDGRNFLWSLSLDRQLTRDIQLSLHYEGRKTGAAARTVHVGRAQVRAVF